MVFAMDIFYTYLLYVKKLCETYCLNNIVIFCANGEHLPLKDRLIDYVQSNSVIEHVKNQTAYFKELYRVLNKEGFSFIASPNRYSLFNEPHTHIHFIGFIPRRFMDKCAKIIKGTSMNGTRLLSYFDIKKVVALTPLQLISIFYVPRNLKFAFNKDLKKRIILFLLKMPFIGTPFNWMLQSRLFIFFSPVHHIILRRSED